MDGGDSPVVLSRFFKVLLPGFKTILNLPPAFTKKLNVDVNNPKKGVLTSCKGSWKIGVKKCSEQGLLYLSGKGWERYVSDHELKIGDFIVFEHIGHFHFTTFVYDETCCQKKFAAAALENNEEGDSDEDYNVQDTSKDEEDSDEDYVQDVNNKGKVIQDTSKNEEDSDEDYVQDVNNKGEEDTSRSSQNVNSQFETILKGHHFSGTMCIPVPAAFARSNGLRKDGTVMLRNATGDSWEAGFKVYTVHGYRVFLRGLGEFFKGNKVNVGDKCIFVVDHVLQDPIHVVMDVQIVRNVEV